MEALGISPTTILSLVIAISFAAGLNVYATVFSLGLMARLHWLALPPGLGSLADTWIIVASVTLFLVELFADKVPYFDLIWNAVHTFVRVPVAALLAWRASAALTPQMQLLVTLAAGLVAAIAHTAKTGARIGVSASPEPLSNIALSSSEDVAAIGLTWVATKHPYTAATAVAMATLAIVVLSRWIFVSLHRQIQALRQRWNTAGPGTNGRSPLQG